MSDVIHIAIPSKTRREGSVALNIPGTGTQFLDAGIVEVSLSTISGQLEDQFDRSDQHILIDDQPMGITGVVGVNNTGLPVVIQDQPINTTGIFMLIDGANPVRKARLDTTTHAQNVIDYAHHEIHAGSHYTFSTGIADLDDGNSKNYILTVPNTEKWPHILYQVDGALFTKVEMFENTTHSTGVAFDTFNNDRNSLNAAGLIISNSSGDGSDGSLIYSTSFGISTGPGGKIAGGSNVRGDAEWILKQDTKYLYKITSLTDNNNISLITEWYEHTNKV